MLKKRRYCTAQLEKARYADEDKPTKSPISAKIFLWQSIATAKPSKINFRWEKTNINILERFIELVEKDLFQHFKYSNVKIKS